MKEKMDPIILVQLENIEYSRCNIVTVVSLTCCI